MIDNNDTILNILRSVSIFAETLDDVLAEVVPLLEEVNLKSGETLFEEGHEGDSMYIIVEGLVRVHQGKKTISNRGDREVFGEMALLSTKPRMGSVTALRDTRLLRLTRQTFCALIEKRPEIGQGIMGVLINRMHEQAEDLSRFRNRMEQVILPLGIALSTEQNVDRLLERILQEAQEVGNADAGTVYLREGDTLKFTIMNTQSLNITLGGTTGNPISLPPLALYDENGEPNHRNIATHVALNNHSVNIHNIYKTIAFDFSATREFDKNNNYRSISCLTFPLRSHKQEVIGIFQLFNAQDRITEQIIPFDPYQQLMVEALASMAAVVLNTQRMIEAQKTFAKLERELQIGHQIQIDFLPSQSELPQADGWEIATRFEPAREVAGDFFDAFTLTGDRIAVVIADVVDKGVGAAIFMALSRSLIRGFAQQPSSSTTRLSGHLDNEVTDLSKTTESQNEFLHASISSALSAVEFTNNYIANNHGEMGMFTTLFFGVIDPSTGVMYYINGGHDAPIFLSTSGEVKARLNPTGPAVGMKPDMEFGIEKIAFEPGDLLMTFSDGVSDALNPNGERFTDANLISRLEQAQPISSAAELLEDIETTLRAHIGTAEQFDDITMLAVWQKPGEAYTSRGQV